MKTIIDFESFKKDEWKYIRLTFPKSFENILSWNGDGKTVKQPYDLSLYDGQLFHFFDNLGIYVCPRVNTQSEFYVEVWIDGCNAYAKHDLKDRTDAEVNGFLFAFDFLEQKLL